MEQLQTTKYALIIGCQYYDTDYVLEGCVNDATVWRNFLLGKDFDNQNITVLRDDMEGHIGFMKNKIINTMPTKENIIDSLKSLIQYSNQIGLSKNIELFFSYSGRGKFITDICNEEINEYADDDEVIVPCDCQTNGYIIDDEFRKIFENLKPSVKCYVIIDRCRGRINLDLPYVYEYDVFKKNIKMTKNEKSKNKRLVGKQIFEITGCREEKAKEYIGPGQGVLTYLLETIWENDLDDIQNVYKLLLSDHRDEFTQLPIYSCCNVVANLEEFCNLKAKTTIISNDRIEKIEFLKPGSDICKNYLWTIVGLIRMIFIVLYAKAKHICK